MSDNKYDNLYLGYQIQAAESILDPDEGAYYRKICRWYSKTFHTPLIQVEQLPIAHVLTNYYEANMESIPYNELYDKVMEDFLPEMMEEIDQDAERHAQALIEEQQLSIAKAEAKKLRQAINPVKADKEPQSLKHEELPLEPEDVIMNFDNEES